MVGQILVLAHVSGHKDDDALISQRAALFQAAARRFSEAALSTVRRPEAEGEGNTGGSGVPRRAIQVTIRNLKPQRRTFPALSLLYYCVPVSAQPQVLLPTHGAVTSFL